MKRIAIIGGGISGLSAAFALEQSIRAGSDVKYTLFESSPRLGGVLLTENIDSCLVEAGPDSFLTEKSGASELCGKVGLDDQLIGSNDAQRRTYILIKERLVPIPDGLMFMVPTKPVPALASSLFSPATKLRMAREWLHPPRQSGTDESVASFVERHYGAELVDRLADPLLSGVYGGEASQLSVRAVLPRFVEMEKKYGSLGKAMMAAHKARQANAKPRPLFTSLKNGMQQMTDAVVSRLSRDSLRLNARVQLLQLQDGGWLVSAGYETDQFDTVIIATPAYTAAALLQIAAPQLASELQAIPYSSSITVALGYSREVRAALPPGFGFLVPRSEGRRMLAATFVHNKFPHRAPEDKALVRGFLGGSRDEAALALSDDEIVQIVREELHQVLNLSADPIFARVYKWKAAMAQYAVGHLERLERIDHFLSRLPGLHLAGNGYRGIGVPDCIRSGKEAAEQALGAEHSQPQVPA